ncbi:hypothetical protein NFJ02_16g24780 [Pycnococcus provasolii]
MEKRFTEDDDVVEVIKDQVTKARCVSVSAPVAHASASVHRPLPQTGDLSISDRMKLVQGVARGIQQQSKPQGNKVSGHTRHRAVAQHYLYDGNDKAFHQWWRAIVNQLSGVYLDGIEELVETREH